MAATASTAEASPAARVLSQPDEVRDLSTEERDRLIVFLTRVDGTWQVVSSYGDSVWWAVGVTTNNSPARTKMDFAAIPECFRDVAKAMLYRYLRRGANSIRRPAPVTVVGTFRSIAQALNYFASLGLGALKDVTPLACNSYAHELRTSERFRDGTGPGNRKSLKASGLYRRLSAVEELFDLSQYTFDAMPKHPWPDTTAAYMTGYTQSSSASARTPLMPDEVFATLFQRAWAIVQAAPALLDLREELERVEAAHPGLHKKYVAALKSKEIRRVGLAPDYRSYKVAVTQIRTACYIVIASLSGCRNHELAYLRTNSYYSTEDAQGNRRWWMRSRSTKTYEGATEWLVPEAAVAALRVMDRWAAPLQGMLTQEIEGYRKSNPADVRIAQASAHLGAIFVGVDARQGKQVRTISNGAANTDLNSFAIACGLDWQLASHQFRRKFANYAARSQFGDLRYLRDHFKHWSLDMTLGYALNEAQEMALFLEVGDELDELKVKTVSSWLDDDEPLAGGYGRNLMDWRTRTENITMFKSRSAMIRSIALSTPIRSNGHAWCTAQDSQCVGNDLEPTRCGDGCDNAVIERRHQPLYQGLYDHLAELQSVDDIGPGGQGRVERDLQRCSTVLQQLGYSPETAL